MGIEIFNFKIGSYDGREWCGGYCDSADGVSIGLSILNQGTKTIKYATFSFIPYNAVGDPVACEISEKSEASVRLTGPVGGNKVGRDYVWEDVWYNSTIRTVKLTRVRLQYMDGTEETLNGSQVTLKTGSCYVATAVYGSYNCPEVWTLRRYRDYKLAETWYGRAFVKLYYAVSPTIVRKFGKTKWFNKMWRGRLDKMVKRLNAEGYESTPYEDRIW